MLHHLADVARGQLRRLGAREAQEVGQDAVEPPRLRADGAQRGRALGGGEPALVGEERGGVDDGGQRVADLVRHARGQLAGGGQALGVAQARVEPLALAARALEHHDDDGEGREEVNGDEHAVEGHVERRAGLGVDELGDDAMDTPEGEEPGEEPPPADAHAPARHRPEDHARRDLGQAEADPNHALPRLARPQPAREGQHHRCSDARQHVAGAQPVVPAVGAGGGEGEAHRGDGGQLGDEARLVDPEHQHVQQLEALGERVAAPGQQQVLEEAHAVRGVEVREDQKLYRERDHRNECQDQRHRHAGTSP